MAITTRTAHRHCTFPMLFQNRTLLGCRTAMLCLLSVMLCSERTSATTSTPYTSIVGDHTTSTPYTSIVGDQEGGGDWGRHAVSSFDFGQEFLVDDILRELEEMGLRPPRGEGACAGAGPCVSLVKEDIPTHRYALDNSVDESGYYMEDLNKGKIGSGIQSVDTSGYMFDLRDLKGAVQHIFPYSTEAPSGRSKINGDHKSNTKDIVSRGDEGIDYAAGIGADGYRGSEYNIGVEEALQTEVAPFESRSQRLLWDAAERADSVGTTDGGRQAGMFFNYHYARSSAFNTTVAFTIPCFTFTLPAIGDLTEDGFDGSVFGTVGFVTLYIMSWLGVAIYKTFHDAPYASPTIGKPPLLREDRSLKPEFPGSQFLLSDGPSFKTASLKALEDLTEALSLPTCAQLAACEAHQSPRQHGALGRAVRMLAPLRPDANLTTLTSLEAAARVAAEGGDCAPHYPCIADPLELAYRIADMIIGRFTS